MRCCILLQQVLACSGRGVLGWPVRPAALGKALHDCIKAGLKEVGDGVALLAERVDDAVKCGLEVPICPARSAVQNLGICCKKLPQFRQAEEDSRLEAGRGQKVGIRKFFAFTIALPCPPGL